MIFMCRERCVRPAFRGLLRQRLPESPAFRRGEYVKVYYEVKETGGTQEFTVYDAESKEAAKQIARNICLAEGFTPVNIRFTLEKKKRERKISALSRAKKVLDEMGVSYVRKKNFIELEDGCIFQAGQSRDVFFVCGQSAYAVSPDRKDFGDYVRAYVLYNPSAFADKVSQADFEELKQSLFSKGYEALSDFVGYDFDETEDKDVVESRLEQAYMQMPRLQFEEFYCKYVKVAA